MSLRPPLRVAVVAPPWSGLLITVLALVLIVSSTAMAQQERATVRVDGRSVFRVGAVDLPAAEERARRIERRLGNLLENPPK